MLSQRIMKDNKYFYETDKIELLAFLGIIYLRGAWNLNFYVSGNLFRERNVPDFEANLSKNQFEFLNSCTTFDDLAAPKL